MMTNVTHVARWLRTPIVAALALLCLVGSAPSSTAQTIDVESDEPSRQLLTDAIEALAENDEAWLADLLATVEAGEVWLPQLGADAIAERDAELLVNGLELLDQDEIGLFDYVYDFVVYERDLLVDARAGVVSARQELVDADLEGQSILEVVDRRGVEVSDQARLVLGSLTDAGGLSNASLAAYEDALDNLDADPAGIARWIALGGGLALVGLLTIVLVRSRKSAVMANTDSLTGLANRRRLARDIDRRSNAKGATAVLMIDVDHFKIFNDTYGHSLGDEVLRLVGKALRSNFRNTDVPYRYGGEEFCVLVADASASDAMHAGERARAAIAALELPHGLRVTASVGVALLPAPQINEAIDEADQALYAAKNGGRNRVGLAQT